jgi:hypothetical protein
VGGGGVVVEECVGGPTPQKCQGPAVYSDVLGGNQEVEKEETRSEKEDAGRIGVQQHLKDPAECKEDTTH